MSNAVALNLNSAASFQVLSLSAAENMTSILMLESNVTEDISAITGAGVQLLSLSGNVLGAAVNTAGTTISTVEGNSTVGEIQESLWVLKGALATKRIYARLLSLDYFAPIKKVRAPSVYTNAQWPLPIWSRLQISWYLRTSFKTLEGRSYLAFKLCQ